MSFLGSLGQQTLPPSAGTAANLPLREDGAGRREAAAQKQLSAAAIRHRRAPARCASGAGAASLSLKRQQDPRVAAGKRERGCDRTVLVMPPRKSEVTDLQQETVSKGPFTTA